MNANVKVVCYRYFLTNNSKINPPVKTFACASCSALDGIGRSFQPTKAGDIAIKMVPRSWTGIHGHHCGGK